MSNFRPAPRKKNYIDYSGLRLTALPVNGSDKRPSFAVSVVKNGIRLDVYTNVEGDKSNGNIRMDINSQSLYAVIHELRNLSTYEAGHRFTVEAKDFIWNNQTNKRSEKMMPTSRLVVGRDKSGLAFISLLSFEDSRPKVQFMFSAPFKNELLRNGQPMPEDELSLIMARSFADSLAALTPTVLAMEFVEPEKKNPPGQNQQRNGGGGNSYGNNNHGGGGNKPAATDSWEDDFAM